MGERGRGEERREGTGVIRARVIKQEVAFVHLTRKRVGQLVSA